MSGRAFTILSSLTQPSKDAIFAERLKVYLESRGVRVWYAPEDLKIGDSISHGLQDAVHRQDKVVLILSAESIESAWVQREVEFALEEERVRKEAGIDDPIVLAPVRIDNSIFLLGASWATRAFAQVETSGISLSGKNPKYSIDTLAKLLRDLQRSGRENSLEPV